MKTLPDAIIAGMSGDSKRVILVRIIPESTDTWAELCWATRDITVTDWEGGGGSKSFAGNMLAQGKLGTIKQSVDIEQGGNVARVSGLTLRVLNPEYNGTDRFDQSFASYNLENREVEIRLVFWTGSSPAWSDTLLRYKGVVEDVSYDYEIYQIKIQDAGFKRHKEIPDLVIDKENYPEAPVSSLGHCFPLLFGNVAVGESAYGTMYRPFAILINKNKGIYGVSRNKADYISTLIQYVWNNDAKCLASISPDGVGVFSTTKARPSTFTLPLSYRLLGGVDSQLGRQGHATSPSALDFKNAVDDDNTSYFTLGASEKLYLYPNIPNFGIIRESITVLQMKIDFGSITGTGKLRYLNDDWDNGVGKYSDGTTFDSGDADDQRIWLFTGDKSAHGIADDQSDQNNPWTIEEINSYMFGIECDAASSAQIKNVYISIGGLAVKGDFSWHVQMKGGGLVRSGLRIEVPKVTPDFLKDQDSVCSNSTGADFGSWIDEDSRNNGYDAGVLIEYGAYMIESILRDELGLTSSEIDYTSFDAIGNTTDGYRKDWKYAVAIEQKSNSLQVIADFCKQMGIIFYQNYENKETVRVLKKQTAVKTIDRTTIQGDSIKTGFSKLDEVYNEFYVRYSRMSDGSYRSTKFITASDHNLSSNTRSGTPNTYTGLCSDSQSKYELTKRLTFDCDCIRDDATAELFIKWLAEWHCYRKLIFPFQSAGLDHIGLELGDQIKIDHTLLPTGISNVASFIVFDIKDDLDNDKIRFECMQVPDLLP